MKQILRKSINFLGAVAIAFGIWFSQDMRYEYTRLFLAKHVYHVTETNFTATAYNIEYGGRVFLVTNKHVCKGVEDQGRLNVEGSYHRILHISSNTDLCILETDSTSGLRLAKNYSVGEPVTCIGFPSDFSKHIVQGHVAALGSNGFSWLGGVNFMETSCLSAPGTSGSPILNTYGNVIGTLFAGNPMFPGGNLAVPLEEMVRVFDFVIKHKQ